MSCGRCSSAQRLPTDASARLTPVDLPAGAPGIGFDDLRFSATLKKLLVPAGRSGNLDLVDPATLTVTAIPGFSAEDRFHGGHGAGTTSVDEGRGLLFAIDRTARRLDVVDPRAGAIVAAGPLASPPDYVRWVAPTGEVWVTQPSAQRIEVFSVPTSGMPTPSHAAFIAVPGGPESLVIDARSGRAYTHLWNGATLAVDVRTRQTVARWDNGCKGSRGIALDATRGFLFAGCDEGKAVVLDVKTGRQLSSLSAGKGVDVIDYSQALAHLYLPGGDSGTMAILAVSSAGSLSVLGSVATAEDAHCVAADDTSRAYICDPTHGRILVLQDTYPSAASR